MKMNHRYDYQFRIWSVWEKSHWLMIEDTDKESVDEIEPFVYLLTHLQTKFNDAPVDLGECRYQFSKDPNHFIWQWDSLYGIVMEYNGDTSAAKSWLTDFLSEVNAAAHVAPAPEDGPDGIDRWTSNGAGIQSNKGVNEEPLEASDIIETERTKRKS